MVETETHDGIEREITVFVIENIVGVNSNIEEFEVMTASDIELRGQAPFVGNCYSEFDTGQALRSGCRGDTGMYVHCHTAFFFLRKCTWRNHAQHGYCK